MKRKILLSAAAAILLAVASAVLCRNRIARPIIEDAISRDTGVEVQIEEADISLFRTVADIRGVMIANPPGFGGGHLAKLSLVSADYRLGPALRGDLDCSLVEAVIDELVIVRNFNGEGNLDQEREPISLWHALSSAAYATDGLTAPARVQQEFKIDKLVLTLRVFVWKDYWNRHPPLVRRVDLNIEQETFEDLTNGEELSLAINGAIVRRLCEKHPKVAAEIYQRDIQEIWEETSKTLKESFRRLLLGN